MDTEHQPDPGPDEARETAVEPTAGSAAEPAAGPAAGTADVADSGPRWRRWARAGVPLLAVLVLAAGLASWWRAAHDDSLALAETRDTVLITGTQHIESMNTLDYREVDAGLERWAAITTGTLHDQLSQVAEEDRALLADQKKISVGTVVDAAVFDLDPTSATVIASVEVTVQDDLDPDAEPTLKRNRFSAGLVKVGGEWLLESLEQVAVDLS